MDINPTNQDIMGGMVQHEVVFFVFDGVKMLDVSGPAEVFAQANGELAKGESGNRRRAGYMLRYASASGGPVATSVGLQLSVGVRARDVVAADTVVIAGGDLLPTHPIDPQDVDAVAHLAQVAKRVCSVCTGAFLMAATGVVSGRRVATHWAQAALLARSHPDLEVDPERLWVRDGRFHSSAGVSTGIDLALALVESDHGVRLARAVARGLVVHLRRHGGQSQFSSLLEVPTGRSSPVRDVITAIVDDPARDASLGALAALAKVSPRHLARLFDAELGMTPAAFVEMVRLDVAKNLLLGGVSVATAARAAGFGAPESMRRTFVSRLGLPPSQYASRFAADPVG